MTELPPLLLPARCQQPVGQSHGSARMRISKRRMDLWKPHSARSSGGAAVPQKEPHHAWWRELFCFPGASPRGSSSASSSSCCSPPTARPNLHSTSSSRSQRFRPKRLAAQPASPVHDLMADQAIWDVRDWAESLRRDASEPPPASDWQERKYRRIRTGLALRHLRDTREKWRRAQVRKMLLLKTPPAKEDLPEHVAGQCHVMWSPTEAEQDASGDGASVHSARSHGSAPSSHESTTSRQQVASPEEEQNRQNSSASELVPQRRRAPLGGEHPQQQQLFPQQLPQQQARKRSGARGETVFLEVQGNFEGAWNASAVNSSRPSLVEDEDLVPEVPVDRDLLLMSNVEDQENNELAQGHLRTLTCSRGCALCSTALTWDDWRSFYPIDSLNLFALTFNALPVDDRGRRRISHRHLARMIHVGLGYQMRAVEESIYSSSTLAMGLVDDVCVESFWEFLEVIHVIATHMMEHHTEAVLSSHDFDHMKKVFRHLANNMDLLPTSQLFKAVELVGIGQVDLSRVEHQRLVANSTGSILEHKERRGCKPRQRHQGLLAQDDFISIIVLVLSVMEQQMRRIELESECEVMKESGFKQIELEDLRALHAEYVSMQVPEGLGALARLVRMLALCGGSSPTQHELTLLRDIVSAGYGPSWYGSTVAPFHVFAMWMHKICSSEICGLQMWTAKEDSSDACRPATFASIVQSELIAMAAAAAAAAAPPEPPGGTKARGRNSEGSDISRSSSDLTAASSLRGEL